MASGIQLRLKTLIKKFGLLAFSVLLLLAGLEVVLRVAPLAPTDNPIADRSPMFYRQAPDRAHPWSQGASNALRIAVIGDSFTVGVGVQLDDTYGAKLERLLNLNDGVPPADVSIYAHSGTSTFQQRPLLRTAMATQPHVVILGICLNDVEDWTHPLKIQRWRDEWMTPAPSPFAAFFLRRSRAASFIAARLWASGSSKRCVAYYRHLYDPDGAGILRFKNAIGWFRDECAARQIAFVPVIFPLMSFDFSPGRYPMAFAHEAIHGICRDYGIPCLDLLPAFQEDDPERMQAVPGIDPHPDEIAHRIAAETILKYLVEQRLVDPGYQLVESGANQFQHSLWLKTFQHVQHPQELDASH